MCIIVRHRSLARARELVALAWRTAYYGRVKHLPDLAAELADLEPEDDDQIGPGGTMSEARMWRVWGKIKGGIMAWNAALETRGAD